MASLLRTAFGLSLLVGSAVVLAAGCGSSDDKKKRHSQDEGGEGGEGGGAESSAGAHSGGAGGDQANGATGGVSPIEAGAGGQGGGPLTIGGAAGAEAMAGAPGGGAPSFECTPAGDEVGVSLSNEAIYQLCRGSVALLPFDIQSSDQQFKCCGTSSANYGVELAGLSNNDGGGDFSFLVPDDAPLSQQGLSIACAGEPSADVVAIEVTDNAFPIVESVNTQINSAGTLTITGQNLLNVANVRAVPLDPTAQSYFCNIRGENTATQITCDFGGGIAYGDYKLSVFDESCGATNTPTFNVLGE
jgi:hypothetical protein